MSARTLPHRFLSVSRTALILSLCLHISLMILFLVPAVLEKAGLHILPKKDVFKEAYQSFIQVDVVALPDELTTQKPDLDSSLPIVDKVETAPEPEEKEETKAEDLSHPETDTKAAEKAAELEKQKQAAEAAKKKQRQNDINAAMKKAQEEAKREQALKALTAKAGKQGRKKIAGNITSKGTSNKGAVGTAHDQFLGRIVEAVLKNFNVYFWQQKKGLFVTVRLEFYPTGKVRKRSVVKRSIDPTYDSAVLMAIDATSFPLPEDPSILEQAFEISFTP